MTPTPKDLVAPLMALVDDYAAAVHAFRAGCGGQEQLEHDRHVLKATRAAVEASARALAAVPAPDVEAAAWVHVDDPRRVISAMQKADATKDGGASASSVAGYTMPLIHRHEGAQQAGGVPTGWSAMRDALESIREHCMVQSSALAKAIVATCDSALAAPSPSAVQPDPRVGDFVQDSRGLYEVTADLPVTVTTSAVQPLSEAQPRKVTAFMEDGRGMFLDFNDGTRVFYEVDVDHEIEDDCPIPAGIVTPKEPT